ncbi:MMPL family transporter [Arenimonas daejeonensis]|uniref:MMPL family transporter n=1 Tax=Arenimonas daejeonensis TaxID=370777 RepID=UPI001D14B791|nr:MMPL family transporter [Arenimonas daejeonensis]
MTEPTQARARLWPLLAWLWLAVVVAIGAQQTGFWRDARLDSDVMALLPGEGEDALQRAANARIGEAATRQVVVLLKAGDWAGTRRASAAFLAALDQPPQPLAAVHDDGDTLAQALALYAPHRRGLLTPAQRKRLETTDAAALAESALAALYGFGPGSGLMRWQDDPLGLWPDWWQARAGRVQPLDGLLTLQEGEARWAVLRLESRTSAFALDGERRLQHALETAETAARDAAGTPLEVLRSGVPLHAEAAAAQASREVNTIGLGSLAAVVLLVWLSFRSLRPILLVALSLLVGVAAGVAATALVFGQVHLLTPLFGASLVGVAEDYGIHYFASRQATPGQAPRSLLRALLPGLALALVTSALAYLALGLAPFPGLRQMALFSATGLVAAFLTVVLWFPWLDRGTPRTSRFAHAVAGSLAIWPRWRPGAGGYVMAAVVLAFIAGGLSQLRVDDDLRSLQSSPPALLAQDQALGRKLGLPSPAQYFLVSGDDPETLRQAEEALTDRLAPLVQAGELGGWRAVSDWLPSTARQQADARLVATAEHAARSRAAAALDEPVPPADSTHPPLTPDDWLVHPVSAPLRPLWLGEVDGQWGSVVLLEGPDRAALPALATLGEQLPGVRWVDRTATYSRLLGEYRQKMGGLLLAGYAAVALALFLRFRGHAWRALLPTALAAALSLATLGWLGVPLQLFGVLAQLLLLGMGVDYGIFLLEHRDDPASWLAVSLVPPAPCWPSACWRCRPPRPCTASA